MKSDIIDIALHVHHETEKAFLVSENNEENRVVWIPKSQCQKDENIKGNVFNFSMSEWIAHEKGFI